MKTLKSTRGSVVSKEEKKAHAQMRKMRKSGARGKQYSNFSSVA